MSGVKDEYGLTPKQAKFAANLAEGMSQSDAYREAYDADGMASETINAHACRLAKRDKIAARVNALMEEKIRLIETRGISDRKQVAELARKFAQDEARPDAIRLRALELWGRTCGAFVEVIEDRRERPTFAVANELERRLAVLLKASAPQITVIDQRVNDASGDDDSLPLVAGSDPAGSGVADDAVEGLNDAAIDAIRDTQTPPVA